MFIFEVNIQDFDGEVLRSYTVGAQDAIEAGIGAKGVYEAQLDQDIADRGNEAGENEYHEAIMDGETEDLAQQAGATADATTRARLESERTPWLIGDINVICKLDIKLTTIQESFTQRAVTDQDREPDLTDEEVELVQELSASKGRLN